MLSNNNDPIGNASGSLSSPVVDPSAAGGAGAEMPDNTESPGVPVLIPQSPLDVYMHKMF